MLCRAGIRLEARPPFRNQKRPYGVAFGQQYEIGATVGYGIYRDGTIYSASGSAEAGIRNRFCGRYSSRR
jgi:hypothetical protein